MLKLAEVRLLYATRQALVILTVLAILQSFVQILVPTTAHAATASNYSCGNTASLHCYARQDWPGGPINGADTTISVVRMAGGNGFVDNEMWVADCDPNNIFCTSPHWIETGYIALYTGSEQFFWSDLRPQDSNLNQHLLGSIPSGDYGNTAYFEISRYTSNSFQVILSSPFVGMVNYSTNNSMTPGDILIGQELAGSSGASAPRAYYTDNQWIDTGNHYDYQASLGSYHGDNPPYVGWTTLPTKSSTGGVLWTNCC